MSAASTTSRQLQSHRDLVESERDTEQQLTERRQVTPPDADRRASTLGQWAIELAAPVLILVACWLTLVALHVAAQVVAVAR